MTPQQEQVLLSPGKTPDKKVSDQKKVEDFLGDAMSLVNLDSLVTRQQPQVVSNKPAMTTMMNPTTNQQQSEPLPSRHDDQQPANHEPDDVSPTTKQLYDATTTNVSDDGATAADGRFHDVTNDGRQPAAWKPEYLGKSPILLKFSQKKEFWVFFFYQGIFFGEFTSDS